MVVNPSHFGGSGEEAEIATERIMHGLKVIVAAFHHRLFWFTFSFFILK